MKSERYQCKRCISSNTISFESHHFKWTSIIRNRTLYSNWLSLLYLSRRFITRFSLLVNSYRRRWSLFLQKGLENWMKSVELKNKSCQFSINLLIYIFSTNLMKNSFTYSKICFKIKEIKSRYNIFTII